MAYYDGETLKEKIDSGPLRIDEALTIAIKVAEGLQEAHEKGIIHRDIKPANIMISDKGQVKIMDFGLAKSIAGSMVTKAGTTLGTIAYMSPEQSQGENVDKRTDIWSLGVMLYNMLTGKLPFKGEYETAIVYSIVNVEPEAITGLRTGIPVELEQYVNKCLAKDQTERYPSAEALIVDLKLMKKDTGRTGSTKITQTIATEPAPGKSKKIEPGTTTIIAITPKKRKIFITAAAIFLLAVLTILGKVFLIGGKAKLVENRVAVAYFENETGDETLDYLERMTADHLAQSIRQMMVVDVAPVIPEEMGAEARKDKGRLNKLSQETGAKIVVSGVIYKQGDNLQFQPQMTDMETGKLLQALSSIAGPAADPKIPLEELRQRVMGALAATFDTWLSRNTELGGNIPRYDAYIEHKEGIDLFMRSRFEAAIERLLKAVELDSMFFCSQLFIGVAYWNLGQRVKSDSIAQVLDRSREQLSSIDRQQLNWLQALHTGNLTRKLRASREIVSLDVAWNYQAGLDAKRVNNLREAEEYFSQVNPDNEYFKNWEHHWFNYGQVLHMLRKYEKELEVALDRRKRFPESRGALTQEIRAHVALGSIEKARELIKLSYTLSGANTPANSMMTIAWELKEHGYPGAAGEFNEMAVEWYRSRPESEREKLRAGLYDALYFSVFMLEEEAIQTPEVEKPDRKLHIRSERESRIEILKQITEADAKENPDNISSKGRLGVLAARLGDRDKAMEIFDGLGNLDRKYMLGLNILWQAAIAANLGEKSRAVTLLQDAFRKGLNYGIWYHRYPIWEPLWDYLEFKEFIRPKGK